MGERLRLVETLVDDGYSPVEVAETIGVRLALVEALLRAMSGESLVRVGGLDRVLADMGEGYRG